MLEPHIHTRDDLSVLEFLFTAEKVQVNGLMKHFLAAFFPSTR